MKLVFSVVSTIALSATFAGAQDGRDSDQVYRAVNLTPVVAERPLQAPLNRGGVSEYNRPTNEDEAFREAVSREYPDTVAAVQLYDLENTLVQGTVIDAVFDVAIDSQLPGAIRSTVTRNVYSYDGQKVVIPSGSILYGEYRTDTRLAQTRILVIWQRVITPDGVSAQIGSQGTDALGRSGVTGIVDTHFDERFGSAALISLIGAIPVVVASQASDSEAARDTADRVAADFSQSTSTALEEYLTIRPTIQIDQGTVVKVILQRDVVFPFN